MNILMVLTSHDNLDDAGLKTGSFLEDAVVCQAAGVLRRVKATDWQADVVTDGLLVTGQNPASSEPAAQALLQAMRVAAH